MKYRLMDFLVEPSTSEPFVVDVFETRNVADVATTRELKCRQFCHRLGCAVDKVDAGECASCHAHEIMQGKLISRDSGIEYPIVNGIPRILPKELLNSLLKDVHSEYLRRYGLRFGRGLGIDYVVEKEKVKTVNAFGYQWQTFVNNYDYFKEIFLSFTRPFMEEQDFKGKTLLEIGCGSGRPGVAACQMGAEVVGMDISEAVESAYSQSLSFPHFHVVQGDAYAPPFRPAFDVVYSVGVLQHIPDPKKALLGISRVVSPGGPLLLWVYGKREPWYQPVEWARKYTRDMPHVLLHGVSIALAVMSELLLLMPFRILSKIPILDKLANRIPGRIYAQYPFRENVVGWFDRLVAPVTYYFDDGEIRSLLEETGFEQVQMYARPDASASWVIHARRKQQG